jgi:hypothetical protein
MPSWLVERTFANPVFPGHQCVHAHDIEGVPTCVTIADEVCTGCNGLRISEQEALWSVEHSLIADTLNTCADAGSPEYMLCVLRVACLFVWNRLDEVHSMYTI